jgi:serine/threonine protein phosphatase PrpC
MTIEYSQPSISGSVDQTHEISNLLPQKIDQNITEMVNKSTFSSPYAGLEGRVKNKRDLPWKKRNLEIIKQKLANEIPLDVAPRKGHPLNSDQDIVDRSGSNFDDAEASVVGGNLVFTVASQGPKKTMEDRHIAVEMNIEQLGTTIPFYGVFDGHRGDQCAQYLKEHFPQVLADKLQMVDLTDEVSIYDAIKAAFLEIDALYREQEKSNPVGSTAVVSFILGDKLWVANAGDCRAVTSSNKEVIQMSQDAISTEQPFKRSLGKRGMMGRYFWLDRITNQSKSSHKEPTKYDTLGAEVFSKVVMKVRPKQPIIAPARTMGDDDMVGVPPLPKIKAIPLSNLDFLVLASDGLWDVMGSQEVVDVIKSLGGSSESASLQIKHAVEQVRKEAYHFQAYDNLTAMIIKFPES